MSLHLLLSALGAGSPSFSMHVAVCIPLRYPLSPPVLALLVDSNGQKVPVDIHLKQLEQELNLGTKGLSLDDPNYERLLVRLLLKAQVSRAVQVARVGGSMGWQDMHECHAVETNFSAANVLCKDQ